MSSLFNSLSFDKLFGKSPAVIQAEAAAYAVRTAAHSKAATVKAAHVRHGFDLAKAKAIELAKRSGNAELVAAIEHISLTSKV